MRLLRNIGSVVTAFLIAAVLGTAVYAQNVQRYRPPVAELEVSVEEPMPSGFGVQHTDVDGPVFVNPQGMTLYTWPRKNLELGDAGDSRGKPSTCTDTKLTETAGINSIYRPGLILPELDKRPSCTQAWPPVFAADDAKPVGNWTISVRTDGRKQWAYEGMPLYTSSLDKKPGQVYGGFTRRITDGLSAPLRIPVGPDAARPPAFQVRSIATGRILLSRNLVIYTSDADRPNVSNCKEECLHEWAPVLASQAALPQGEWGVIERAPGVKQWTFRTKPVYTLVRDQARTTAGKVGTSLFGNDVPGWKPAYTQKWPDPPKEFTVQDSRVGQVLADKNGMTLYTYMCNDDAFDQLACDHPTQTQVYRIGICGRFDVDRCNALFPYALAPVGAKTDNMLWGATWIDPKTGHHAEPNASGAIHVWTYRDRPIFTHGRDTKPGDANGDAWGENNGLRNGFKAIWIRDDFNGNAA